MSATTAARCTLPLLLLLGVQGALPPADPTPAAADASAAEGALPPADPTPAADASAAEGTTSASSSLRGANASAGQQFPLPAAAAPRHYKLDFEARGASFFDGFNFRTDDGNHGASLLMSSFAQAAKAKVVEAHPTHAIIRAGSSGEDEAPHRRASAKISTRRSWKYFLAAMRYTHLPSGCGVWPSFFTMGTGAAWPAGGELDVLEWVNDMGCMTSFHTSAACVLDPIEVNKYKPMRDTNAAMNGGSAWDCQTTYCAGCRSLGCAPNVLPLLNGAQWASRPGVIAVERTPTFAKVFFVPDGAWQDQDPQPDTWNSFLIAYYPFGASKGCPNAQDVMGPQSLTLSLYFCGDWASKVWKASPCANVGPKKCRAVDPLAESAPEQDCCTQFIWDEDGKYGTDAYLQERAFFNISWLRVYV